jgi:hypothetical protein
MASTPTLQFDRALAGAIASEPGVKQQMASGSDFTRVAAPTRQLLAESAAIQSGNRGLLNTDPSRQFVQQGYVSQRPTAPSQGVSSNQLALEARPQRQQAAAPATPTQPGVSNADLLGAMNRYSLGQGQSGLTYDSAYDQELSRQQGLIDSINAKYAGLIDDARDTGTAQKSRARAIANTAGSLYSPRTEAEYNSVDGFTNDSIRALEAQKGAEIAAAMGMARAGAFERYQLEAEQALTRGSNYVDNLLSLYNLQQDDRQNAASIALAEAGLTGRYGDAPTLDFLNYQRGLGQDAFDQRMDEAQLGLSRDQLQLQRDQFNQPDYQYIELADGSYGYFDPVAGQVVKLGSALPPGYGTPSSGGDYSSRYSTLRNTADGAPSDEALLDYYNATGKYPSDANDISTVRRIYDAGIDSYNSQFYGPAFADSQTLLDYNPFLGAATSSGGDDLFAGLSLE